MSEVSQSISIASSQTAASLQRRKWILIAAAAAVGVTFLIGAGLLAMGGGTNENHNSNDTATVRRTMLPISVTESGVIMSANRQIIANELRWPVVIEELAEADYIKKGELIIRFSCEELDDAIEEAELDHQTAQDEYDAAVSSLEISRMQAENNIRKARMAVEDAENDLRKYMGGEWVDEYMKLLAERQPATTQAVNAAVTAFEPAGQDLTEIFQTLAEHEGGEWCQKRDESEADMKLAQGDLLLATERHDAKVKINSDPSLKQPYSKNEIESERLNVERLKLKLQKAVTSIDILHRYTHPRAFRDKLTGVTDAKLKLAEALAGEKNKVNLAKTKVAARLSRLKRHKDREADFKEDFATKLKYVADAPGLVVYDTGRRRGYGGDVKVAVGERINPRQQLMIIPDMSTLQVDTKVLEAVAEQVHPGLPATIRLDARPGTVLRGNVTKIAPLPDTQNRFWSPDVKMYPTIVSFEADVAQLKLKPEMTAQVEIILAELTDVLTVPISAIFTDHDVTFCYRRRKGTVKRVPVAIGRSSETLVEILLGLNENDKVLLAPPPDLSDDTKLVALKAPGQHKILPKKTTTRPTGNTAISPRGGRRGRGSGRGGGRH